MTLPLNRSITDIPPFGNAELLSLHLGICWPLPLAIMLSTSRAASSLPCTSSHLGDSGIALEWRHFKQFMCASATQCANHLHVTSNPVPRSVHTITRVLHPRKMYPNRARIAKPGENIAWMAIPTELRFDVPITSIMSEKDVTPCPLLKIPVATLHRRNMW